MAMQLDDKQLAAMGALHLVGVIQKRLARAVGYLGGISCPSNQQMALEVIRDLINKRNLAFGSLHNYRRQATLQAIDEGKHLSKPGFTHERLQVEVLALLAVSAAPAGTTAGGPGQSLEDISRQIGVDQEAAKAALIDLQGADLLQVSPDGFWSLVDYSLPPENG